MDLRDISFKSMGLGILLCGCALLIFLVARSYTRSHYQPRIPPFPSAESLGIKDVITKVQDELRESEKERTGSNKSSLFQVKDFELEIKFVINTKTSDNQQANLELITLDTKAEYSQEKVHQIKLRMVVPEPKPIVLVPSASVPVPTGQKIETLGIRPQFLEEK